MESAFDMVRRVVTLDEDFYRQFLASENAMKRGFLIFIACFFIATIPVFGQRLIDGIQGFTPQMAQEFQDQFLTIFEQFQPPGGGEGFDTDQFKNNFLIGVEMGQQLDEIPAPLPRPVAAFFRALGAWATAALSQIGPWLGYGALVLLFAKMAGGRAVLNPFFGLTALVAVPNLLRIFNFIPFIGPALTLVGVLWGVVVYVRAVQISQDFSAGKAFFVSFLPALIVVGLTLCFGSVGLFSLASVVLAGQ